MRARALERDGPPRSATALPAAIRCSANGSPSATASRFARDRHERLAAREFNFLARHFVGEGARFVVEAPCYDRSLSILRRLGAEAEQVRSPTKGTTSMRSPAR